MGWKGDQWCWFCRADLYVVRDQQEGHDYDFWDGSPWQCDPRSFDWHMEGHCMHEGFWTQVIEGAELRVKARGEYLAGREW